jgi:hypothetical protein
VTTFTCIRPAACFGVTTVSLVDENTFSRVPRAVPKSTARTLMKWLPQTVTLVPPAVFPDVGEMWVTLGLDTRADALAAGTAAGRTVDGRIGLAAADGATKKPTPRAMTSADIVVRRPAI